MDGRLSAPGSPIPPYTHTTPTTVFIHRTQIRPDCSQAEKPPRIPCFRGDKIPSSNWYPVTYLLTSFSTSTWGLSSTYTAPHPLPTLHLDLAVSCAQRTFSYCLSFQPAQPPMLSVVTHHLLQKSDWKMNHCRPSPRRVAEKRGHGAF